MRTFFGGLHEVNPGDVHTMFRPPRKRLRADPHRKACERARAPAHKHDIEIERFPDGGMMVWPPVGLEDDPFESDHFANDWHEALNMLKAYAVVLDAR